MSQTNPEVLKAVRLLVGDIVESPRQIILVVALVTLIISPFVGYVFLTGLVLFPFGFFSASIKEQGFDSNLPLESMYLVSLAILVVSFFLLYFYRDPQRDIESGIVSPADGLIQRAEIKKGMCNR